MAGTIVCDNITNGSAQTGSTTDMIKGSARAWVNFNGTGTVVNRASYNVSSITDNGTGDYTVNFATPMVDVNYVMAGSAKYDPNDNHILAVGEYYTGTTRTTSSFRVVVGISGSVAAVGARIDSSYVTLVFFR